MNWINVLHVSKIFLCDLLRRGSSFTFRACSPTPPSTLASGAVGCQHLILLISSCFQKFCQLNLINISRSIKISMLQIIKKCLFLFQSYFILKLPLDFIKIKFTIIHLLPQLIKLMSISLPGLIGAHNLNFILQIRNLQISLMNLLLYIV